MTDKINIPMPIDTSVSEQELAEGIKDEYGVIYSKDGKKLLKAPKDLEDYTIKQGALIICDEAFSLCKLSLTNVTIPSSVTTIGKSAFWGCRLLKNIIIPSSITTISDHAFSRCDTLESVIIPTSVTALSGCFSSCRSLKRVNILGLVKSIEFGTFYGCSNLESVILPVSVTTIGRKAFQYCRSLKRITIPDSVKSIEVNAFSGCSSLESVDFSNSLTTIGYGAFSGCGSLRNVALPDSVTTIGYESFSGCRSLRSIILPNSVTTIGWGSFSGCSSLRSLVLPGSVTTIENSSFRGCSSLKSVTIPNSVTVIGEEAFARCSALESLVIPDSVTVIGEEAFCDCSSLKPPVLPDSVKTIGENAFLGCCFNKIASKSYIVITCSDDADPKFNRIQLRTDPPKYIELQPGKNILTVEEYPDLKFGFSQIDNHSVFEESDRYEYNGEGIRGIDLSHFDGSELTNMDRMFYDMRYTEIDLGNLDTSHVTSMVGTFYGCYMGVEGYNALDLSNLDLSKLKDTSEMFSWTLVDTLILPALPAVSEAYAMFGDAECYISEIIFNKVDDYDILKIIGEFEEVRAGQTDLFFRGIRKAEQIKNIIILIEQINSRFSWPSYTYNFASNIKYRVETNEYGDTKSLICDIHHEEKRALKIFDIDGNTLTSVKDKGITVAYIPDGITDIGENAFRDCTELEAVVLPESIKRIHDYAFSGCKNLTLINIPENTKYIGDGVFNECGKLRHLYIPNQISSWGWIGRGVNLDYLRIPYDIWAYTRIDHIKTKNLVIGLSEDKELILSPWENICDNYNIILEPYAATGDQCSVDGYQVINGMIMGFTEYGSDIYSVWSIFSIPKHITAIPSGVERICNTCGQSVSMIYMPETVWDIEDGAFSSLDVPIFVTKKDNLERLISILPIDLGFVRIHTI